MRIIRLSPATAIFWFLMAVSPILSAGQPTERAVHIGRCAVSPIPGWDMSVNRGSPLSSVKLKKRGGTAMWIGVQVFRIPVGIALTKLSTKPVARDMKRIRASVGATEYKASIFPTKFSGHSGWKSVEEWKEAGNTVTVHTMRFITGRDECSVSLCIKRKRDSPADRTVMNATWNELIRHVTCSG